MRDNKGHFMKGNIVWNKGKPRSEETKIKISLANKGKLSWVKGKKRSEATKKKISETRKKLHKEGKLKSWNKGKKLSEKHKERISKSRQGEKNPIWNGGKWTNYHGYVMVMCKNHPNCDKKGYVKEARLLMEKEIGRYLTKEEIVHHINGIKDDNRLENLQLMKNNAEHMRLHHEQRRRLR